MEVLWVLYLTVCTNLNCMTQEVQRFENRGNCIDMQMVHEELPVDGNWKSVNYSCRPKDSLNA